VAARDTSPTGRKYFTGILLHVKQFKHKKTDVELTTFVDKMDKQVMEHTECHNGGGGWVLHDRLFWREYQR
jgi:hypothetical protein